MHVILETQIVFEVQPFRGSYYFSNETRSTSLSFTPHYHFTETSCCKCNCIFDTWVTLFTCFTRADMLSEENNYTRPPVLPLTHSCQLHKEFPSFLRFLFNTINKRSVLFLTQWFAKWLIGLIHDCTKARNQRLLTNVTLNKFSFFAIHQYASFLTKYFPISILNKVV